MGIIRDKLRGKDDALNAIFNRYGLTEVKVFGSVAKGLDTEKSDLDIKAKYDFAKGTYSGKLLSSFRRSIGYEWSDSLSDSFYGFFCESLKAELVEELYPFKEIDLWLIGRARQGQRAISNMKEDAFDKAAIPIEKFY